MNDIRKDCKPEKTINNIKKILKKNKIKIKEYKTHNIDNNFYSTRIEIKGFYNLGCNGKGLTKNLAKASAYAELMERLQSRMLINTYYLNKENSHFSYKDEKYQNLNNPSKITNSFFENENDVKDFLKNNKKFNIISNYINILNKKSYKLPSKLINATSFSNGLCAGNNYYEAINQGICEIFERYSYRQILRNEIPLNNIIIDKYLPIYSKIKEIENKGFNITIKDCTLGKYPVIGVLITNVEKTKYLFTIGSDANINIAIQRCLTEAFQGLKNKNNIINKMKPYNNEYNNLSYFSKKTNWLKNYSANNGIHPTNIFNSNKEVNYKELNCFTNTNNNKEVYESLIKIIKQNKHNIYYKEFSTLGFPTYKLYIPTLSNIDLIESNEINIIKNYDLLKNIYFNLNNASKDDLVKSINIIEEILNYDKYSFIQLGNYFHANNFIKTKYNDITFELLYILINLKLNKKPNYNLIKNQKLIKYIKSVNEKNKFYYILKDLKIKLPSCPNCPECKIKSTCKYKNWQKINNVLIKKEKEL